MVYEVTLRHIRYYDHIYIKYSYTVDGKTYKNREENDNYHLYVSDRRALIIYDPLKPSRSILANKPIPGYNPELERKEQYMVEQKSPEHDPEKAEERAKRYEALRRQAGGDSSAHTID